MLELDNSRQVELDVSNDAFSYLYFEEEPLDDSNQEEIDGLINLFEHGYFIDNYEYLENTGLVRISITPYVESAFRADYIVEMINSWVIEYKIVGSNVEYRFNHYKKGPSEVKTVPVDKSAYGKSCDGFILEKSRLEERGFTRIPFGCSGTKKAI